MQTILENVTLSVEFEYSAREDYPPDKQHLWDAYPRERYTFLAIRAGGVDIFDLLDQRHIERIIHLLEEERINQ